MYLGKMMNEYCNYDDSVIIEYEMSQKIFSPFINKWGEKMVRKFSLLKTEGNGKYVYKCLLPMYHEKEPLYLSNFNDLHHLSYDVLKILKDSPQGYFPLFYVDMHKRVFMDILEKSPSPGEIYTQVVNEIFKGNSSLGRYLNEAFNEFIDEDFLVDASLEGTSEGDTSKGESPYGGAPHEESHGEGAMRKISNEIAKTLLGNFYTYCIENNIELEEK